MTITTLKTKEQIVAETYMRKRLSEISPMPLKGLDTNSDLINTNILSAIQLLTQMDNVLTIGSYPVTKVTYALKDYLDGDMAFSKLSIPHDDFIISNDVSKIVLPITDDYAVMVTKSSVKLETCKLDMLSLHCKGEDLDTTYRLDDDGLGYINTIDDVDIYLVYKNLFKSTGKLILMDGNYMLSPDVGTGDVSVEYFSSNHYLRVRKGNDVYAVETSSIDLLEDVIATNYRINPPGLKGPALKALVRRELDFTRYNRTELKPSGLDITLYGKVHRYYVDEIVAKEIASAVNIDHVGRIEI